MPRVPGFARDFHQRSLFNKDLKEKTAGCDPETSHSESYWEKRIFLLGKELLYLLSSAQEERDASTRACSLTPYDLA